MLNTTGGSLPAGKYYLDSDLTLSTAVAVSGGSESKAYLSIMNGDVELCLNGHILRGSSNAQIFAVGGTGTLTLCDCDDSTEHKYYVDKYGRYTFDDSGYDSAQEDNRGVVYGGGVTGGHASNRAGALEVFNKNSKYVSYMTGGTLAGNYSSGFQAAINVTGAGSTFVLAGGEIRGNYASEDSTMISAFYSGRFVMLGGAVRDNAPGPYGGVSANSATVEIYGGTVEDNKTKVSGTATATLSAVVSSTMKVYGGNFSGTANSNIYIDGTSNLQIYGGYFEAADLSARTVLGRKIDAGSTIIDLGVSAGRYRYRVVEAIWESDPTIDDWVYGNSASVPVCNVIDGATVELEYKGASEADTAYTEYDPLRSYSVNVGKYTLRATAVLDTVTFPMETTFSITPRPITMTGVTAKDREYDGTSAVELSGGELVGVVAGAVTEKSSRMAAYDRAARKKDKRKSRRTDVRRQKAKERNAPSPEGAPLFFRASLRNIRASLPRSNMFGLFFRPRSATGAPFMRA